MIWLLATCSGLAGGGIVICWPPLLRRLEDRASRRISNHRPPP